MLRAALIGLPATGKTTLFQLMTAVREPAKGGRGDVQVGISKVPDPRLDRLTAMFNPKKRVPATVEFADIAGASTGACAASADTIEERIGSGSQGQARKSKLNAVWSSSGRRYCANRSMSASHSSPTRTRVPG